MSCGDIFLGVIAIIFPPIAVWIKSGICSADSLINILLCMLGYLPGLLHAWYIIAKHPERDYDYEVIPDAERGHPQRVTYYYINHQPASYGTHAQPPPQQQQQQGSTARQPAPPANQSNKPNKPTNRPVPPPNPAGPSGPSQGAGSGEEGAPPSYSEVVRGDNKIQRAD